MQISAFALTDSVCERSLEDHSIHKSLEVLFSLLFLKKQSYGQMKHPREKFSGIIRHAVRTDLEGQSQETSEVGVHYTKLYDTNAPHIVLRGHHLIQGGV